MRLIALTVVTATLVLMSPAEAQSPIMTLDERIMAMDKEPAIELAISTVTTDKQEAACAKKIAYKESRYNVDSYNKSSGARGVWQLLWGQPEWSILKQTSEAHEYVLHRYGTWCKAYKFHQERNWY
jgi:hypothetical protein